MQSEKYVELRKKVMELGLVHERLRNKARAGDYLSSAALIGVETVLANTQEEFRRHIQVFGAPEGKDKD